MAIDWGKVRQDMTSDKAYRGTGISRPRGPSRAQQRLGFRPVSRQPGIAEANIRPRQPSMMKRVGDYAKGIYNTGKEAAGKFMNPTMMLANSVVANQAQHDYLDKIYGDAKNTQFWNQAMGNLYADPSTFDPRTQNPAIGQFGKTDTGTSLGQAGKYLSAAGITDNVMQKFMDPSYKFAGNEAWLRSQAHDKEKFDDGMSFIKNAKATANLARATRAMEAGAFPSDRQPGLDMDITADLPSAISYADPDPENDLLYGEPGTGTGTERVARGLSYPEPDMFDTLYGEPTPDPFGGMYESPLTDRLYGEPTNIGLASEKALGKRGFANPGGEGYTGPLPLVSIGFGDDDPITPNIADLDYFNQFTGRDFANPGGVAGMAPLNLPSAEEQALQDELKAHIDPRTGMYTDTPIKPQGRWGNTYNQYR